MDVSYWYIQGWVYYYLHTVLDDHSRYIITSHLYRTYGAADGIRMLEKTLAAVPAAARPNVQLLADHGVTYMAESFRTSCKTTETDRVIVMVPITEFGPPDPAVPHPSSTLRHYAISTLAPGPMGPIPVVVA